MSVARKVMASTTGNDAGWMGAAAFARSPT
jgi:hypothetical protein